MPKRTVTDKQLAADRANAARSTGPRSPQGKARSAQNATKHGFAGATFAVVQLEDLKEVSHLKDDLVAFHQPVNSQELFAIERIALAQQSLVRTYTYRLESGLFTTCLAKALDRNCLAPTRELDDDGDTEITPAQDRNYYFAAGFVRQSSHHHPWTLFLRYQAQADRQYRRAVEDLERLIRLRPDLPNEPISARQPQATTTPDTPPESNPLRPETAPEPAPAAPPDKLSPAAAPHRRRPVRRAGNACYNFCLRSPKGSQCR